MHVIHECALYKINQVIFESTNEQTFNYLSIKMTNELLIENLRVTTEKSQIK